MYAVYRESTYDPDQPIQETPEFQEFQNVHADQPGYRGTVVIHVSEGRHLTVTLRAGTWH